MAAGWKLWASDCPASTETIYYPALPIEERQTPLTQGGFVNGVGSRFFVLGICSCEDIGEVVLLEEYYLKSITMYKLNFVTSNQGKIASFKRDLADLDVALTSIDLEISEIRADETREIAKHKAEVAFEKLKQPCIAQDGGFYIPTLNGFPKVYVNFVMKTIGLEGILKLVAGKDRACEFQDTFAYKDGLMLEPMLFTSITRGSLAESPRGELHEYNWGELHKIFIPQGWQKTFAEMTQDEMSQWSQTNRETWSGVQFADWLKENRLNNISDHELEKRASEVERFAKTGKLIQAKSLDDLIK
ncbi:MAG: non-canonical purine NTP pyrophosphatase [bacterium]